MKYVLGMVSAAAVISFFFGIYFYSIQAPSIENYIKTSDALVNGQTDKVTLVLDEGKSIDIDGDHSEIEYSSTGEKS